jgi:hypothetical protein
VEQNDERTVMGEDTTATARRGRGVITHVRISMKIYLELSMLTFTLLPESSLFISGDPTNDTKFPKFLLLMAESQELTIRHSMSRKSRYSSKTGQNLSLFP